MTLVLNVMGIRVSLRSLPRDCSVPGLGPDAGSQARTQSSAPKSWQPGWKNEDASRGRQLAEL